MNISIGVPYERGTQLREFAVAHRVTVTDAIGLLLDHAARTGLGKFPMPGIEVTVEGDKVKFKLDDFAPWLLSTVNVRSLAGALRGGKTMLNLDCPNMIEISRRGAGVVIKVHGEHGAVLTKAISRGVANGVADRLDQACAEIEGRADNVAELLGDLESGT
jgi:hypothetical protein